MNSTITDNHVSGGGSTDIGGLSQFGPTITIINSTIAGNSAEGGVGGLFANDPGIVVANSIIAGNSGGANPDCRGLLDSTGYNIIGDPTGCTLTAGPGDQLGTQATPLNPLLAPLGGNGGLTPTMALLEASPARDAGSPAPPTDEPPEFQSGGIACSTSDQRGVARPGGARCDIGAFEVAPPPPPPPPPVAPPPPPVVPPPVVPPPVVPPPVVPPPVVPPPVVPPPVVPPPVVTPPFVAPPIDHFKCYEARQTGFRRPSVRLRDQFASRPRAVRLRDGARLQSSAQERQPCARAQGTPRVLPVG